jgi:hypothetical protein
MTTKEYIEKTEKELVDNFLKTFYSRVGYYPVVITKEDLAEKSLNLLSLEELERYFDPYLPTVYGKRLTLSSKLRVREIVELRQMFCFISRNIGFSLKRIGQFLGNRDHTTIIHNLRTFYNLIETDGNFKERYNRIIKKIKEDGNYYNASAMVGSDKTQFES